MPPAQEPGPAPMNIRAMSTMRLASLRAAMSTLLKPAVRAITDWKKEVIARSKPSPTLCSLPARKNSMQKISTVPATIRNRLVLTTRRLKRLKRCTGAPNLPPLSRPRNSRSTPKPMPPRMTLPAITRLTTGSSRKGIRLSGLRAKPALQKEETAWKTALKG